MEIWFNKKNNGIKTYKSRVIGLRFFPQHWKLIQWKNNGAVKGVLLFNYKDYDNEIEDGKCGFFKLNVV